MNETVEIVRLGHAGDGVTVEGAFVPYTVPGDVVRIERAGTRIRIEEIVHPGPWRTPPPCRHFGVCGGCALQMIAREPYLAWKRDLVVTALKQRGFQDPPVEDIRSVPPGTRRRAMFKARRMGSDVQLGFYEPESRNLVDLAECPILLPSLARLIAPLRARLGGFLESGETAELHTTATDTGIDLSLKLKGQRSPDLLMAFSELAFALKLARLSWNGETVAVAATPSLRIGKFVLALPIESFLQPTGEGECILQELVCEAAGSAKFIADLFSGCGTFALSLASAHRVHAVDNMAAQLDALSAASRADGAKMTVENRDPTKRHTHGIGGA